jgi:hypothetical protein
MSTKVLFTFILVSHYYFNTLLKNKRDKARHFPNIPKYVLQDVLYNHVPLFHIPIFYVILDRVN